MKKFLALALALVMIFALCACGVKTTTTTTTNADGSTTTTESTAVVPDETIKIGVVCPISGNSAIAGKYITHGVQVIENQLGGKFNVNGVEYPIEFVYMDNEASEEKTTNVFQKLIEEEKVVAIVGPDMSKCALAAGPIAQQAGVPVVATFATNTAVTEVGNYIFRACFIDPFQGKMAATYVWNCGYKTAGIMFNNADAYSVGLTDAFKECYEALGGKVVIEREYSGSDVKDYNVQLTDIVAAEPECLFFPNLLGELGLQIKEARDAGLKCPIVCGDSADTPEVGQVAGEAVKGVGYVSAFSAESDYPAAVEFVKAYTTLFPDELPNSNAELAYEATQMVLAAITAAGGPDRAAVRDALDNISGLDLPSGTMTMDKATRNPVKGGVVMEYDETGVAHFVSAVNP